MDIYMIAFVIIISTILGWSGTQFAQTAAAKAVGFVGMFLTMPIFVGVVFVGNMVQENTNMLGLTLVSFIFSLSGLFGYLSMMAKMQEKLDKRPKKA